MKSLGITWMVAALVLAAGAWADESGERAFNQAAERFERLHALLREVAEQGGVEEDSPLAAEIAELFKALEKGLGDALEPRFEDTPPELRAELEKRGDGFEEIAKRIGESRGAVEPHVLDELAKRFWHAMEPVGAVLGVHRPPVEGPPHFDVTARLEFSIEGMGDPVVVSLAEPHYQVAFERSEHHRDEASAASNSRESRYRFEAEGELHPAGERWLLHCRGVVSVTEESRDEASGEAENESHRDGEVKFASSLLIRPGTPNLIVGSGDHMLRVTLGLED